MICLLVFFLGVIFRIYPTTSADCFATDETCTQVGRLLLLRNILAKKILNLFILRICYAAALILYSIKTIRYMILMPSFGPKYQIMIEMVIFYFMLFLLQ